MQEQYIDTAIKNVEREILKQKIRLISLGLVCLVILAILVVRWITPNDIREYPNAPGRIFSSDPDVAQKYCGEPMYIRGNVVSYDQKENGEIQLLVHTKKGHIYLERNMEQALFSMDHVPDVTGECNIFFVYQGWDQENQRVFGNYLGLSQGEGEIYDGWAAYKEVRVHFYTPRSYREENAVTPTPIPTP